MNSPTVRDSFTTRRDSLLKYVENVTREDSSRKFKTRLKRLDNTFRLNRDSLRFDCNSSRFLKTRSLTRSILVAKTYLRLFETDTGFRRGVPKANREKTRVIFLSLFSIDCLSVLLLIFFSHSIFQATFSNRALRRFHLIHLLGERASPTSENRERAGKPIISVFRISPHDLARC